MSGTSLVDELVGRLADGTFEKRLERYCRAWRRHPTRYVLGHAIDHLVLAADSAALDTTLRDPRFRELREDAFGPEAFRRDVQKALRWFAHGDAQRPPDLLRFLRLVPLQAPVSGADRALTEYARFLQLDIPPDQRKLRGIHAVLSKLFPLVHRRRRDGRRVEVRFELVDYEIGQWRCRCGARSGWRERFAYRCRCGAVTGRGRRPRGACATCGAPPAWDRCEHCGTRITLAALHQLRAGTLAPSDLRTPVVLVLRRTASGEADTVHHVELMQVPLPLGLEERNGRLRFSLPNAVWFPEWSHTFDASQHTSPLFRVRHGVLRDLSDALFQTLRAAELDNLTQRQRMGLLGRVPEMSLLEILLEIVRPGDHRRLVAWLPVLWSDVLDRLGRQQKTPVTPVDDADDLGARLTVPIRARIVGDASVAPGGALVHERLCTASALGRMSFVIATVVLRRRANQEDALSPAGHGAELAEDGVVHVGRRVEPGDVLVAAFTFDREPVQESPVDKLLRDIFGDSLPPRGRDKSIRMPGQHPGVVVGVDVVSGRNHDARDALRARRSVRDGERSNVVARISVYVAIEEPLVLGDRIETPDGAPATVTEIVSSARLEHDMGHSEPLPDVIVSADHAWLAGVGRGQSVEQTLVRGRRGETATRVVSRGRTLRSIVQRLPIVVAGHRAPGLSAPDLDWLLAADTVGIAHELVGPRSDCEAWSEMLMRAIHDEARVPALDHVMTTWDGSLSRSPSGLIREVAVLLHAMGIAIELRHRPRSAFVFSVVSSRQMAALSAGEVTETYLFDAPRMTPHPGGLLCQRIFGPVRDDRCACVRPPRKRPANWGVCQRCGVARAKTIEREFRTGHIRLGAEVLHPVFRGQLFSAIERASGIGRAMLDQLVLGDAFVIEDVEGNLRVVNGDDERLAASQDHPLWGAAAVQCLMDRYGLARRDWEHAFSSVVEVIPPAQRPVILHESGPMMTDNLNELYRRLIIRATEWRRTRELPEIMRQLEDRRCQKAVDELMTTPGVVHVATGVPCTPMARLVSSGRGGRGAGSLFDRLASPEVDFSAVMPVTMTATPELARAFAPEPCLWDVHQPWIERALAPRHLLVRRMTAAIRSRSEDAIAALKVACDERWILAIFSSPVDSARPRALAFRAWPWSEPAFGIHPEVMKLVGLDLLGAPVRLFALFTEDAVRDAARLCPGTPGFAPASAAAIARVRAERLASPLSVPSAELVEQMAQRAHEGRGWELSVYERIILRVGPARDDVGNAPAAP